MTENEFQDVCRKLQDGEQVQVKVLLQGGGYQEGTATDCDEFLGNITVTGFSAPIYYDQVELA